MSEDQNRDLENRRPAPDVDDMFSEQPGGTPQKPASDDGADGDAGTADAVTQRAKQARVRRRRDDTRRGPAGALAKGSAPAKAAKPRPGAAQQETAEATTNQPQPRPAGKKGSALPALRPDIKADTPALRAERVEAIRRDLVRRRRRKGGGMLLKLWFFVFMPTLAVAAFMWFEAADLYKSEATFVVQSADTSGATGGGGLLGGLLGGGGGGSIYDPIAVQTFILSRDVLRRLDAEQGWIAHFQDPDLDFWHGLSQDASFEDAFGHYERLVTVSYDPTEGMIEMTLIASDPQTARRFSEAVISYAEEMVDNLSDRIKRDSVSNSERYLAEAEAEWQKAQRELAQAQNAAGLFSTEGEFSAKMSVITSLEGQLAEREGRLANIRRIAGARDPRVQKLQQQVTTLRRQIAEKRAELAGSGNGETLADANTAFMTAKLNVEMAGLKYNSALEQLRAAQASAESQSRYLSVVTRPSLPDEPNFPKKPEMTALAFVAFLGFYIIASLTWSLIREQASI